MHIYQSLVTSISSRTFGTSSHYVNKTVHTWSAHHARTCIAHSIGWNSAHGPLNARFAPHVPPPCHALHASGHTQYITQLTYECPKIINGYKAIISNIFVLATIFSFFLTMVSYLHSAGLIGLGILPVLTNKRHQPKRSERPHMGTASVYHRGCSCCFHFMWLNPLVQCP